MPTHGTLNLRVLGSSSWSLWVIFKVLFMSLLRRHPILSKKKRGIEFMSSVNHLHSLIH